MAKWIWNNLDIKRDDYSIFKTSFKSETGKISLKISADTDYMVFVNKKLVAFDQYPCFPYAPVYDEVSFACKKGDNEVTIIVYYFGSETHSTYYYSPQPGVYFEFKENDKVVCQSDEHVLSTRYLAFESGHCENITNQLGYRVFYDARKANKKLDFQNSVVVDKSMNFSKRENKKLKLFPHVEGQIIKKEPGHILIDFGKEYTAYFDFDFKSSKTQKMKFAWGEHIVDSGVRYSVGGRTFVTEFHARRGRNKFFSTLRRYGLRYLEVFFDKDATLDINKLGLRPVYYPFKERKFHLADPVRDKIYQTAVYTLKCCYHEHFEDCPWREQSFYVMDSRNQMLYHYYAFKNPEAIKSSLILASQDNREDGILTITMPANFKLTIPSYGLYYFEECYLYTKLYKDESLVKQVYPKLCSLMDAFVGKVKDGVLYNFLGPLYWNFYEWVPGLDYPPFEVDSDVILNSLFIIAMESMNKIAKIVGDTTRDYTDLIKLVRKNAKAKFFDKETGLFKFSEYNPKFYCLANSLACLAGLANKKEMENIGENLIHNPDIIKSSISLRVFMYDLLMKVDKNKYKDYILNDIDTVFKYQLDHDATTFWETELGEKDFDNAGSLCHAWCSLAIYYYRKLI